jgi:CBS domain-containing protein
MDRKVRMLVKEIMNRSFGTITSNATINTASRKMREAGMDFLFVKAGRYIAGIVTDRDVQAEAREKGLDPKTDSIEQVMTSDLLGCYQDTYINNAAAIMKTYELGQLAVFERNTRRLVGVLSIDDLSANEQTTELADDILASWSQSG